MVDRLLAVLLPCFRARDFNSIIPIDVVRLKLDSLGVPVGVAVKQSKVD